MAIKAKIAGAYQDVAGVFVKRSGVYEAVAGVFAKVGGVYDNIVSQQITFAFLGDSTNAQGSVPPGTGSTYGHAMSGLSMWLLILTDRRVSAPVANNIAVAGSYIEQVTSNQVQLLDGLSEQPTDIVLRSGTNNLSGGYTLAQMKASYVSLVSSIAEKSYIKRIWCSDITPRTLNMTATLYQRRKDFNSWLALLVAKDPDTVSALAGAISVAALSKLQRLSADFMTMPDGDTPVAGSVQTDNLHLAGPANYGMALQISAIANALVPSVSLPTAYGIGVFNATTNPTGNLLNKNGLNRGLMLGIGGLKPLTNGVTATGQVPDIWMLQRSAGAGTVSELSCSKLGVAEDGMDGVRIRYTTSVASGVNDERFVLTYADGVASQGVKPADGLVADVPLVFRFDARVISNNGSLKNIFARAYVNNPASANSSGGFSVSSSNSGSTVWPSDSDGDWMTYETYPVTPSETSGYFVPTIDVWMNPAMLCDVTVEFRNCRVERV